MLRLAATKRLSSAYSVCVSLRGRTYTRYMLNTIEPTYDTQSQVQHGHGLNGQAEWRVDAQGAVGQLSEPARSEQSATRSPAPKKLKSSLELRT